MLFSNFADVNDMPVWKTVGNWTIRVDTSLNHGCFMVAVSTRGTIFRIGLNQKYISGYLMLGDADWASLEEGKKYKVVIQLDDLTPWDAEATGFRFKPVRPGDFIFLDTNFKNPIF